MAGNSVPNRRAKMAVTAVSGGLLAMIWSGVWYAAVASGRSGASQQSMFGCQVLFFTGLLMTVVGVVYLRRRKLSVIDGSSTHLALPPAADTTITPTLKSERVRV